jgi:peptidoglycan/LPS O-acetylase OafA/YrhL
MRLLAWIGTFSYSLYLTHIMSTGIVAQAGRSHLTSPGRFWIVLIAEVAVAVVVAYPFSYLFERPFLSRKRIVQAQAATPAALAF